VDSSPYSFLPSLVRGNRDTAYVFTGADEIGTSHNFRNFLRFDLPPDLLGPGEEVVEAVVWSYYAFDFTAFGDATDVPGELRCHEILEPWEEGSLTWVNQPAIGPPVDVQPQVTGLGLLWCDVTDVVRAWLTGARPHHGIAFTNPTERLIGMNSFEVDDVDPLFKPSLVVETAPAGGPDTDADGIADAADNCAGVPNPSQADADGDGVGNACDVCRFVADPDQADVDGDGLGDACQEAALDLTGDGLVDASDAEDLSAAVGTRTGDPGFDPARDFDGDGETTQRDVELWARLLFEHRPPACGLVGLEALLPVGLAALRRRRRRAR